MKYTFTLFAFTILSFCSFGQVVYQNDLSTWGGGLPSGWEVPGGVTSLEADSILQNTTLLTPITNNYGSDMASLVNIENGHRRFTTSPVTVTPGQTYDVKMYLQATSGEIRTNYYDITNGAYGSYNSYIDLSVASAGSATMVSQTVTIPAGCTSANFILSIRNTEASTGVAPFFVGIMLDSVDISVASVSYTPTTIYDIQYTTAPSGDSPEDGNFVQTSGVVTAVWPGDGYWIQDGNGAWNGLYIDDATNTPSVDDSVTVEGQVAEFFNLTRLENITSYTLESAPAVIPTPTNISSADASLEDYESVLISLSTAECINENAGFGNWTVNTNVGTPADSILIADELFSYNCPVLGDDYDITGIGYYSFSERKILPRDVNDINGGAGCGSVTIYDIQYTTAPSGDSPELGNVVTVAGIVTGVFQIGSDQDRFFIQDGDGAWNGIFVYENGYTVALGDSVWVTGEVVEFNNLTEISWVSDVTIVNSGNPQPTPAIVTNATVNDEEWEGVLVTLEDGICTVVTDGFGVWEVNDGTAAMDVKIDDDLLPATFTSVLGDGYDVTGVRHYTFGETKIYPRSNAEIVTVGFASVEDIENGINIYPNPADDNVVIYAAPDAVVAIYSMTGAIVANGVSNQTIDVSGLESGIYQIVVNENGNQITTKLVIR